jgi:predicted  nucleic acid-binding Zn-ribbon protein
VDVYSTIQLQLQEVFNKINDTSINLAGARNELIKAEKYIETLDKGYKESKAAFEYVKSNDVVSMSAYVDTANRTDGFDKARTDAKVAKLVWEQKVKGFTKDMKSLKAQYASLEAKMKVASNNVTNIEEANEHSSR